MVDELVDPEVGVSAFAAQKAATWLLQIDQAVLKDEKGQLFVKIKGADGKEGTYTLRDGVRQWMRTRDGQVFLPGTPAGAGTIGSTSPQLRSLNGGKTLNRADQFQVAVHKQTGTGRGR